MKIGILTFHASHNYGSMLQAYALQYYLNTHGHDAETINLRIEAQRCLYRFPLSPKKGNIKALLKSVFHPISLFNLTRKWMLFELFLKKYIRLTDKIYKNWEELNEDLPRLGYDVVITGGDQIWNMNCRDASMSYYLPSKLQGIKKISYSTSFGGTFLKRITPQQEVLIKQYLSDFSFISVREDSMQKYLSGLLKKEITMTCDPTLLLLAEDYDRFICDTPLVNGNYIYYYTPPTNQASLKLVRLIGEHYGLKIVTSYSDKESSGLFSITRVGPAEFLNLVKNAKLVVGKSFHLVVFSLLFHKDFIALDGEKDARMKNLLEMIGLQERGKVNEDNYNTIFLPPIDYGAIDIFFDRERYRSEQYLKKVLSI